MVAEIPLGIITAKVILGEGRCRVACRVEAVVRVDAFLPGDNLWHNTESTIGKLFNAPELLVGTGIGGDGGHLLVGSSSQSAISTLDNNLEVGISEISTLTLDRRDSPTLVGTGQFHRRLRCDRQ